jgi:urease accessory protein
MHGLALARPLRLENDRRMIDIQQIPAIDGNYPRLLRPSAAPPVLERARGHARLSFASAEGETRLVECFQSGSAKIRLPRTAKGAPKEAIFLNTAGGVTGGDHLIYEVAAAPNSCAVITTQAAERVYRRSSGVGRIETSLTAEAAAHLEWLPQETIVFDNSALSRQLSADVSDDATLLAVEAIVLGRAAMGETTRNIQVRDSWRVRRNGKMIFADGIRLEGDALDIMAGNATGRGAVAFATVLLVSPDAGVRIESVREVLDRCDSEGGASAWNHMLVLRIIASTAQALRSDLVKLVECLRGASMPRVWSL